MSYNLKISRTAEKEIARLTSKIRRQMVEKIQSLEDNPYSQDIKQLKGEKDAYRVDSGKYRILFHLDDKAKAVTIFRVKHRRDVYRNL
ncbi:MAG: type II toxin-antitoxin system RelE/ParE family toxin [Chloroflexi bacterium]|nr:type II toxin-antitoxin system RelE/ParE family toxin [Chloroflexota bacterium]